MLNTHSEQFWCLFLWWGNIQNFMQFCDMDLCMSEIFALFADCKTKNPPKQETERLKQDIFQTWLLDKLFGFRKSGKFQSPK